MSSPCPFRERVNRRNVMLSNDSVLVDRLFDGATENAEKASGRRRKLQRVKTEGRTTADESAGRPDADRSARVSGTLDTTIEVVKTSSSRTVADISPPFRAPINPQLTADLVACANLHALSVQLLPRPRQESGVL